MGHLWNVRRGVENTEERGDSPQIWNTQRTENHHPRALDIEISAAEVGSEAIGFPAGDGRRVNYTNGFYPAILFHVSV